VIQLSRRPCSKQNGGASSEAELKSWRISCNEHVEPEADVLDHRVGAIWLLLFSLSLGFRCSRMPARDGPAGGTQHVEQRPGAPAACRD